MCVFDLKVAKSLLRKPHQASRGLVVGGMLLKHPPTPPVPDGQKLVGLVCQCPTQCLFVDISFEKRRLVEDLSRLLNDIRYGSFIIVGLPGKLPKASGLRPIFFQQKREKIKDTTLLKWSEIRKLSARQDLLWSSFLTMSFFSKRGKKTC